jgi:hypothetical protein
MISEMASPRPAYPFQVIRKFSAFLPVLAASAAVLAADSGRDTNKTVYAAASSSTLPVTSLFVAINRIPCSGRLRAYYFDYSTAAWNYLYYTVKNSKNQLKAPNLAALKKWNGEIRIPVCELQYVWNKIASLVRHL